MSHLQSRALATAWLSTGNQDWSILERKEKTMTKRLRILIPAFALVAGAVSAQDAKAVLQKASSAMGNANSIQYTGTSKAGLIGQSFTPTVDWPMVNVTAYTRTIDYGSRSSREEMTR